MSDRPASPSQVLGLQACAVLPAIPIFFLFLCLLLCSAKAHTWGLMNARQAPHYLGCTPVFAVVTFTTNL